MILSGALAMGTTRLREAGIDGAARDAQLLLAQVLRIEVMRLSLERDMQVSPADMLAYEDMLDRRIAREPVSKIIGRRQFWGRDFTVTRDVLDPRPETETLIAEALTGAPPSRILDLGTGSGILAITLLAEWREAFAVATDLSDPALKVAARNATLNGVDNRLTFLASDWFARVQGRFDLIVSNPPYIAADEMPSLAPEVLGFDPQMALTPGGDGLDPYRKIAAGALAHMDPGGRLLVEIGFRQGRAVSDIFAAAGLDDVRIHPDMDGRDRVIGARAPLS
ncbi:[protein release factor]-glutamine N5-methyltransferase [Maritimibacter alkaliphilus HTCC2654]|uniref:Release factor glutamine methyltransferase n=1 Tax=Maritimibacter alkaliphilus HTCC2654 TaxID=314271 RepID=A3VJP3_9RHOB|nr:Putative methylase [Rhodobacterales bacterium HTCC2654] [Maritimibacter alkaliphilus HTCC2654]TYP81437.1 [protein release factor]-glutamine N5-methyltransferase [Maritimibacter alkaliphilus HTCC2654]